MTRAGLPTCSWATATARRGPSVRRLRGCPARCAAMPICARFAYFGCGLISSCRLRRRHRVCNTRVTSGSGFVLSVVSCVCCVCVCVCRVWIWRLVNTRSYVCGENAETVNGTSADRPPDTQRQNASDTAHPTRPHTRPDAIAASIGSSIRMGDARSTETDHTRRHPDETRRGAHVRWGVHDTHYAGPRYSPQARGHGARGGRVSRLHVEHCTALSRSQPADCARPYRSSPLTSRHASPAHAHLPPCACP